MLPTEGSASPSPESQLCSPSPQAVTPRSSTHLTLDDLRQLLAIKRSQRFDNVCRTILLSRADVERQTALSIDYSGRV